MAIGERIHFFRILRGMTQKYLGTIVGFPERSADVRLAQYETPGRRTSRAFQKRKRKQEQENRKRNLLLHWHRLWMFPLMPLMCRTLTAISD